MIDSLLEMTGYEKVKLSDEGKVMKTDPRIMLSCSAVAKGYAVDVIAQLLKKKGIRNFMVDIGGEVVVHGQNPQNGPWRIGLNKPIDDSLAVNQELQAVLQVTDLGMATSGNYRNYYYKDGKKYAHTIDPAYRLSGTAQHLVSHRHRQRLHECRRLCHGIHGDGAGRSRTRGGCTSGYRRLFHLYG